MDHYRNRGVRGLEVCAVSMSQTSIIFAALVLAFLIFITMRGELPAYISVFL
jgi:hypothetical protein